MNLRNLLRGFIFTILLSLNSGLVFANSIFADIDGWQARVMGKIHHNVRQCRAFIKYHDQVQQFHRSEDRIHFINEASADLRLALLRDLGRCLKPLRRGGSHKSENVAFEFIPVILESLPAETWRHPDNSLDLQEAFFAIVSSSHLMEHWRIQYPSIREVKPEAIYAVGQLYQLLDSSAVVNRLIKDHYSNQARLIYFSLFRILRNELAWKKVKVLPQEVKIAAASIVPIFAQILIRQSPDAVSAQISKQNAIADWEAHLEIRGPSTDPQVAQVIAQSLEQVKHLTVPTLGVSKLD